MGSEENGNVQIILTPLTTPILDFHRVISTLMTPTPSLVKTSLMRDSIHHFRKVLGTGLS